MLTTIAETKIVIANIEGKTGKMPSIKAKKNIPNPKTPIVAIVSFKNVAIGSGFMWHSLSSS